MIMSMVLYSVIDPQSTRIYSKCSCSAVRTIIQDCTFCPIALQLIYDGTGQGAPEGRKVSKQGESDEGPTGPVLQGDGGGPYGTPAPEGQEGCPGKGEHCINSLNAFYL